MATRKCAEHTAKAADTGASPSTSSSASSSATSSASDVLYVYSTLANDQKYIQWERGGSDMHVQARSVLVKGGAGVTDKRIVTPLGVVTEISAEDAALLENNPLFRRHAQKGYVRIDRVKADPEKVAADMNRIDPSAPKTPADYADAANNAAKPQE